MSSRTLAPVTQGKFDELVDMVAMVNMRNNSHERYIFHDVRVHASGEIFTIRAMIDTEMIYNLIAQRRMRFTTARQVPTTLGKMIDSAYWRVHRVIFRTFSPSSSNIPVATKPHIHT